MEETTLTIVNPAMFRARPVAFIISVLLIAAYGLGLVILLIWFLKVKNETLTITNMRVIKKEGILSKHTNELRIADVKNIKVSQGLFQRMFGTGTLEVASAATGTVEVYITGVSAPQDLADMVRKHQAA